MNITTPRWMTTAETCAYLRISRPTLYRYIAKGLPSHQPGGVQGPRYFDVLAVDAWIRSKCSAPAPGHDAGERVA